MSHLVLLPPLVLDLLTQIGRKLIVNLLIHEDSLHQSFENIDEMDLLLRVLMHLDLQVTEELKSVSFLHDDLLLGVYEISILLLQSNILLILIVFISQLTVDPT